MKPQVSIGADGIGWRVFPCLKPLSINEVVRLRWRLNQSINTHHTEQTVLHFPSLNSWDRKFLFETQRLAQVLDRWAQASYQFPSVSKDRKPLTGSQ